MADDATWSEDTARVVASNVRYWRLDRKMSAQALADAMSAAGVPITRQVLANFETGRRPHVSVSELMLFAAILRVPPTGLLLPYPPALDGSPITEWAAEDETGLSVEVLPGRRVTTGEALAWWSSPESRSPWSDDAEPDEPAGRLARLLRHQDFLVQQFMSLPEIRTAAWEQLLVVRAQMRAAGDPLPDLPDDLAEREATDLPNHWLTSDSPNAQQRRMFAGLPRRLEVD
ncbi:helix-turn-helix domain-containing protein [Spongisporangium articulatum]|uniref:Helix-turn-helix domain-containing protein n=1 Tax=Spongisporangium articulatum TaxID=3362603 RepID=A0ABW8AND0_9ACTN